MPRLQNNDVISHGPSGYYGYSSHGTISGMQVKVVGASSSSPAVRERERESFSRAKRGATIFTARGRGKDGDRASRGQYSPRRSARAGELELAPTIFTCASLMGPYE